jgi:hypothetical protein
MSAIKNIKPIHRKNGPKQGYYEPINENKYVGPRPIIYRSSWERKFAIYCDTNTTVLKWSSEPFPIRYFSIVDQKYHSYYPDFYMKVQRGDMIKEYVVEVKPSSQLRKPIPPKTKNFKSWLSYKRARVTYITNFCKSAALKKFAEAKHMEVLYITEKSFFV